MTNVFVVKQFVNKMHYYYNETHLHLWTLTSYYDVSNYTVYVHTDVCVPNYTDMCAGICMCLELH